MSHEITKNDSALFVGEGAWHGLGKVIPGTMSAGDALPVAGLDWSVDSRPVYTAQHIDWIAPGVQAAQGGDWLSPSQPEYRPIMTHKAQVRSDNGAVLGIVSAGYTTVQNSDLARIADAIAGEGGCRIESMGSMREGRRVWILARGESFDVGKGDEHAPYVVLANGHDGSMSLRVLPTTVRVVCANTLAMALTGQAGGFTFRHTSGLSVRIDEVRDALRRWGSQIERDREVMNTLQSRRITREQIEALWVDAISMTDGDIPMDPQTPAEERKRDRAASAIAHMSATFDREASRWGATAYVAANAATNWIQHERGRLSGDARAASRLFGDYGRFSAQVMNMAEAATA